MIVIFDRQHYGKPNKPQDRGAAVDLDGDGTIENDEKEANLTPGYYLPAKDMLERRGHSVYVLQEGYYGPRHQKANRIAAVNPRHRVAYVACHINAGKGDYSAMIHDQRSAGGKALAEALAAAFGARKNTLTGVRRHLVRAATSDNAWSRGLNTIKGIYAGPRNISGVCFEPYFLDREEHQWLASPEGGRAVAESLVAGLVGWGT